MDQTVLGEQQKLIFIKSDTECRRKGLAMAIRTDGEMMMTDEIGILVLFCSLIANHPSWVI